MTRIFNSTIKSLDQIKCITEKITVGMDEPRIKTVKASFKVLPPDKFESELSRMGIAEHEAKECFGVTRMLQGKKPSYKIMLRENEFPIFFPTYFHELGHALNEHRIIDINATPQAKRVYSETLAYAFEGYAKEEFNRLNYKYKFLNALHKNLKMLTLGEAIRDIAPGHTINVSLKIEALATIYAALKDDCDSYEDVYHKLRPR